MEYTLVYAKDDSVKVRRLSFMWVAENERIQAYGKSENEAVYNLMEFLRKEELYNQQQAQ